MAHAEHTMTPTQMAALVDTALRSPYSLTYFDMAMTTFRMIGRHADATATALMGYLYADGEIELLMRLRATWKQEHVRDPETVLRPGTRRHHV